MTQKPSPSKFQDQIADFVKKYNLKTSVANRLLDLVSEVGEVSKEILIATDYGKRPFEPNDHWAEEIGDLFFSLVCIANASDVNLLNALEAALSKYENRLRNQDDPGSG